MDERERRYRLPSFIEFIRLDETTAILAFPDSNRNQRLDGESVALVARAVPALQSSDGATVSALATRLSIPEDGVRALLGHLDEAGALRTTETDLDFFDWATSDPEKAREAMEGTAVTVITDLDIEFPLPDGSRVTRVESLAAIDPTTPDVLLSLTRGTRPSFHRELLDQTYAAGCPWLPGRLVGRELRIGPLTDPGNGACYNCFARRREASCPANDSTTQSTTAAPYLRSIETTAAGLLSTAAAAYLARSHRPRTLGAVVRLDVLDGTGTVSDVLRLPNCDICSRKHP